MSEKPVSTKSACVEDTDSRTETEPGDAAPPIGEAEWEIAQEQLFAVNPQAAAFGEFPVRIQEDAESGREGRARAVEASRAAIGKIEGVSSK